MDDIYDKLISYLKKIEKETSKPIKILESNDLGLKGMLSAFRYHPDQIIIIIKKGVKRSDPDLVRSIAHEATHGYLIFKLGYCRPVFKDNASENHMKNAHLIFTMMDDIVVNKIIQENGFPPFGSEYLVSMNFETKSALKGENIYQKFSEDPIFDSILMVSRYIIAWSFIEFYNIGENEKEAIKRYLTTFESNFPEEMGLVSKIKYVIKNNDIFIASGHCQAIEEILDLWDIKKFLKLERVIND
jgi:hypothetical protein